MYEQSGISTNSYLNIKDCDLIVYKWMKMGDLKWVQRECYFHTTNFQESLLSARLGECGK